MQSYFTKQVVVSGTDYRIEVFTDIYAPVDATGVVQIGVYDSNGSSILTDASKLVTNNSGISSLLYGGINPDLAVTLSKQTYSPSLKEYVDTPLSQNIKDLTQPYFQCNTLDNGVLNIFAISILASMDDGTAGPASFDSNTTYTISIDFNALLGITPADSSNVVTVDFITDNNGLTQSVIKDFSKLCANTLFALNNLEFLDDIKNSFIEQNPFNYMFTPVIKNESGQFTNVVDSNGNDVVIHVDMASTSQDLFVKQYLSEYKDYFDLMDTELKLNPRASKELLDQTKIALFARSNLLNSFVKGTLKGIEMIFGLFCKNIGEYTFRVENSPLNSRFIYRITSDLPKVYWTSVVKDIVHPISWMDEYIQIDNGASQLPTTSASYTDPRTIMYDSYIVNTRDYDRKYRMMINGLRNKPKFYVDIDRREMYNGDTRFYELAMISDMTSHRKFGFKPNEYEVDLEYDNPDLKAELENPANFVYQNSIDQGDQYLMIDLEFLMHGIALQYQYRVITDTTEYQSVVLNVPRFRGQFPLSLAGQEVTIEITLINAESSIVISNKVTLPSIPL